MHTRTEVYGLVVSLEKNVDQSPEMGEDGGDVRDGDGGNEKMVGLHCAVMTIYYKKI